MKNLNAHFQLADRKLSENRSKINKYLKLLRLAVVYVQIINKYLQEACDMNLN